MYESIMKNIYNAIKQLCQNYINACGKAKDIVSMLCYINVSVLFYSVLNNINQLSINQLGSN